MNAANWRDARPADAAPRKYSPEWYEREDERDGEPHTWAESWLFILPMGMVALGVYIARSWGWLP